MKNNKSINFIISILICIFTIFFTVPVPCLLFAQKNISVKEDEAKLSPSELKLLEDARQNAILEEYAAAEKMYANLIEKYPDLYGIRIEIADLFKKQMKWDKAAEQYREVIFLMPDDNVLRFEYARILLWGKNFKDAEKELFYLLNVEDMDKEKAEQELLNLYLESKNWDSAAAILKKQISANPSSAILHFKLGQTLSWAKQFKEAVDEYNNAISISPDYLDAKKELAYCYICLKDWANAEKSIVELFDKFPEIKSSIETSYDLYLGLANIYAMQKNWGKAIEMYDKVLSLKPNDTGSRFNYAISLAMEKRFDDSEKELNYLHGLFPERDDIVYELINIYVQAKRWQSAAVLLREMIAKYSNNNVLQLELADVLCWDKQYKEALKAYRKALKNKPDSYKAKKGIAYVQVCMKKTNEAEASLRGLLKAMSKDDNYLKELIYIHKELANLYSEQRKWDKALNEWHKLSKLMPGNITPRIKYARILVWAKHYGEAYKEFSALYNEYPENKKFLQELANVSIEQKNWINAEQYLQELIKYYPDDVKLRVKLGKVYSWNKQYNEAINEFQEVLKIDPNNIDAKKERAYNHMWLQMWPEAEKELKELIAENPKDRDLQEKLGDIYFYQKRYNESRNIYAQIITFNPEAARYYSSRMTDIDILMGPLLSYSFYYYNEQQKSTGLGSDNMQNMLQYLWPVGDRLKAFVIAGCRQDNVVSNSYIFGGGGQLELSQYLWIEPRVLFEPNYRVNPRNKFRVAATVIPVDALDVQFFDEYTRLWNSNRANSCGMLATGYFLKDKSMRLRYGLFYDWEHAPSDYFVRINKPPGLRLDRRSNMIGIEKDFELHEGFTITPGYNFSYDSTDVKTNTFLVNAIFSGKYMNLICSASYGWDSEDYIYKTAGCYFSKRF